MRWQDLLLRTPESRVLPWVGGRRLVDRDRTFRLAGSLPNEHGWHRFAVGGGRTVLHLGPAEPDPAFDEGREGLVGVLVGNRLIPDAAAVVPDPHRLIDQTVLVHLVAPGLPRFSRGRVARDPGGPWVFVRREFPLGPEHEVQQAFVDRRPSTEHVPGVPPALDLAFRFCTFQRDEAARRRAEAVARAEAARREAQRQETFERLVTSACDRRRAAEHDFEAAASAALALSGAELLDHQPGYRRNEVVVQYRFRGRRFESVVDRFTLRIIDAGICLEDHHTAERGDDRFTLESLPGVIDQAIREDVLVVFRHLED